MAVCRCSLAGMTNKTGHWSSGLLATAIGGLCAALIALAMLFMWGGCSCQGGCSIKSSPRDAGSSVPAEAGIPDDAVTQPDDAASTDAATMPVDAVVMPDDSASTTDAEGHGAGSFAVAIKTSMPTNCARSGSDIAEFTVALVDPAGACIPVMFHLETGASSPVPPVTDVRSMCPSAPARFSCFEVDTLVTVQGLTPGGYHLVVEGVVGDRTCWRGDLSIGVSDTRDEETLTLLRQDECVSAAR